MASGADTAVARPGRAPAARPAPRRRRLGVVAAALRSCTCREAPGLLPHPSCCAAGTARPRVQAPTELAQQLECLRRDGAVVIPSAYPGPLLAQVRGHYLAAWGELEAELPSLVWRRRRYHRCVPKPSAPFRS